MFIRFLLSFNTVVNVRVSIEFSAQFNIQTIEFQWLFGWKNFNESLDRESSEKFIRFLSVSNLYRYQSICNSLKYSMFVFKWWEIEIVSEWRQLIDVPWNRCFLIFFFAFFHYLFENTAKQMNFNFSIFSFQLIRLRKLYRHRVMIMRIC